MSRDTPAQQAKPSRRSALGTCATPPASGSTSCTSRPTCPNASRQFIGEPGGNAFSTTRDLLRFSLALQAGELLSPTYTEMFLNGKVTLPGTKPGSVVRHAFGTYGAYDTVYIYGHGGGAEGETANWSIYRDLDWTTVILSNYGPNDLSPILERERNLVIGGAR